MTYLVCGPPCAGKSTWVDQRFTDGDIVMDYDAIMAAVCRRPVHEALAAIKPTVLEMFGAALKNLPGNSDGVQFDGDIYVVATMPAAPQRVSTAAEIGANIVVLDPGKDACIERAQQRPYPQTTVAAIETWYERFTPDPTGEGAMRFCLVQGCNNLVISGRCQDHKQAHERWRGSRHERGYGSQWVAQREAALPNQPLCPNPFGLHDEQVIPSQQRDHIKAKQFGGSDEPDNLWFLCVRCHGHKTRLEQMTGAPVIPSAAKQVQAERGVTEYAF